MAVRPWENRFLDSSNLREDVNLNNMEQSESVHKTQMKSASRMPNTSTLVSGGVSSGKATGPSMSDNDSSSPGVSSSIPVVSKARSKLAKDDLAVEVNSRRPGAVPRSHSNPKERSSKERLSLPNSGQISFSTLNIKRIVLSTL